MVQGIDNRTENWKTARSLAMFFGDRAARLAGRLGEPQTTPVADVKLELYWKGVRDWLSGGNKDEAEDPTMAELAERYQREHVAMRCRPATVRHYGIVLA